jgi:hypothetical protein
MLILPYVAIHVMGFVGYLEVGPSSQTSSRPARRTQRCWPPRWRPQAPQTEPAPGQRRRPDASEPEERCVRGGVPIASNHSPIIVLVTRSDGRANWH